MRRKYETLPEQVGTFTVLGEVEPITYPSGSTHRRFSVRCKCGQEYTKVLYDLLHSKGCRECLRKNKFPVGAVVGSLTVVEERSLYRGRPDFVRLRCVCGKDTFVLPGDLARGRRVSCGCSKTRTGPLNKKWGGFGEISGQMWSHLQSHARNRRLSFEVSIEHAWKVFQAQSGCCALSGVSLKLTPRAATTASLDRIDSTKGYVEGNIQWVHKTLNRMKWDLTEAEFQDWCQKVVAYNLTKGGT